LSFLFVFPNFASLLLLLFLFYFYFCPKIIKTTKKIFIDFKSQIEEKGKNLAIMTNQFQKGRFSFILKPHSSHIIPFQNHNGQNSILKPYLFTYKWQNNCTLKKGGKYRTQTHTHAQKPHKKSNQKQRKKRQKEKRRTTTQWPAATFFFTRPSPSTFTIVIIITMYINHHTMSLPDSHHENS
jgi:hypothetical protein